MVLNYNYLFHFCKSQFFIDSLTKIAKGASYPAVSDKDIFNLSIPLPPLPEQERIAGMLDAAVALRRADAALVSKYDELTQAVFYEMFGDPVKNEKGWEVGTVEDLVSEVNYGTSKKAEENGHYPYLRMNNVTYGGHMDYSNLKYINLTKEEEPKYLTQQGDILFNRTNSKELVGKTGIIRDDVPRAIAGYLIRVRTNEKAVPDYLWAFMNIPYTKSVLLNMCKSIVGMANINAKELQKIKILFPPLPLQQQFAERVAAIEALKVQAQAGLRQSEALVGSLMGEVFGG